MTTEQWLNDMIDDIVMEYGVSHDTARIMLFAWLAELLRWSPKFYAMMDYLLNDF
jgi:hypothetical protein